ncbi:MAG: hypothetical protein JSW08_03460 [archaeon]|nr:MAG: hypothetical protein JSW08_03460 [archaeon]
MVQGNKTMKYIELIILLCGILLIAGCVVEIVTNFEECVEAGYPVTESHPRQCRTDTGEVFVEELVGGQRDEYGCLNPAGYSYNATLKVCLREWEIDEPFRDAISIAREYVLQYVSNYGLTVVNIIAYRCPGCYDVEFERLEQKIMIYMGELNVTDSKFYCSPESRDAEVCYALYAPVCGYNGTRKIDNYSNDCNACGDEMVEYYKPGKCE